MKDNHNNITLENITTDAKEWQSEAVDALNEHFPNYMHYHDLGATPHNPDYYLSFQWFFEAIAYMWAWLCGIVLWVFNYGSELKDADSLYNYFITHGLITQIAIIISALILLYTLLWSLIIASKILKEVMLTFLLSMIYNKKRYGTFLAIIRPSHGAFTLLNSVSVVVAFEKILNMVLFVFERMFYLILIYGLIRYNTDATISILYLITYGIPLFFAINILMRAIPILILVPHMIVVTVHFILVNTLKLFVSIVAYLTWPINRIKYKLHYLKYTHGRSNIRKSTDGELVYCNDITRNRIQRLHDLFVSYLPTSIFIILLISTLLSGLLVIAHYASKVPFLMFVVVIPIMVTLWRRLQCTENIITLDISIAYINAMFDFSRNINKI